MLDSNTSGTDFRLSVHQGASRWPLTPTSRLLFFSTRALVSVSLTLSFPFSLCTLRVHYLCYLCISFLSTICLQQWNILGHQKGHFIFHEWCAMGCLFHSYCNTMGPSLCCELHLRGAQGQVFQVHNIGQTFHAYFFAF